MRKVVVLPAPLGPRKPVMVPGVMAKLTSSTARTLPKRFVRCEISMTATVALPSSAGLGEPG